MLSAVLAGYSDLHEFAYHAPSRYHTVPLCCGLVDEAMLAGKHEARRRYCPVVACKLKARFELFIEPHAVPH